MLGSQNVMCGASQERLYLNVSSQGSSPADPYTGNNADNRTWNQSDDTQESIEFEQI